MEKPGIILRDILWGFLLVSYALDLTFSVELRNIQQHTWASTRETVGASVNKSGFGLTSSIGTVAFPNLHLLVCEMR